jgi:CDP-diacylglycerol pyrophosphatase
MSGARRFIGFLFGLTAALAVAGGARAANPDALWTIVHERCVPDQLRSASPRPCEIVDLAAGYSVLKDLVGETQFLLIPTARIGGIESPELLAPDAPNYFAHAWSVHALIGERAHRAVPRDAIALAINSIYGRTQNQLHIHIDCLRADVRAALRAHAAAIGESWSAVPAPLAGHRYLARRLADLSVSPFRLLAEGVPGAAAAMGSHTLVLAGATFPDGGDGFYLLDGRADLASLDRGSGEELQDHGCAVLLGAQ